MQGQSLEEGLVSPRTGVIIAYVPPWNVDLKAADPPAGELIWRAFAQFVKKTSMPDSVLFIARIYFPLIWAFSLSIYLL